MRHLDDSFTGNNKNPVIGLGMDHMASGESAKGWHDSGPGTEAEAGENLFLAARSRQGDGRMQMTGDGVTRKI